MKWATVLFALFLVLIIVLADTANLGALGRLYMIPYADKVGHFILYGILALLLNLTLFRTFREQGARQRLLVAIYSGLALALVIGLEEVSQRYFASRTFSLSDLGASYLGVIFFSWVALKIRPGVNDSSRWHFNVWRR